MKIAGCETDGFLEMVDFSWFILEGGGYLARKIMNMMDFSRFILEGGGFLAGKIVNMTDFIWLPLVIAIYHPVWLRYYRLFVHQIQKVLGSSQSYECFDQGVMQFVTLSFNACRSFDNLKPPGSLCLFYGKTPRAGY